VNSFLHFARILWLIRPKAGDNLLAGQCKPSDAHRSVCQCRRCSIDVAVHEQSLQAFIAVRLTGPEQALEMTDLHNARLDNI
jgi:hypothetical protein